ncbi:hypothetical protein DM02DRAFT_652213 [Periconia macrospinosa]|uniref:Uncharacterized protein n=1 Tax=Periconia macrospinosa TaxID=97972 RepID=A0A2V1E2X6_9PLEO|nr:hypothetical protein DM02DRAFT_652213 [Periconia macrospinosa]
MHEQMDHQPQPINAPITYFYFDSILQPPPSPTAIMKIKSFVKKIAGRIFDFETDASPRRTASVGAPRRNVVWPYQRRILERIVPGSSIIVKAPMPRIVVTPPTPTAEQVLVGFTLDDVVVEDHEGVRFQYYPDDESRGGMIPQRMNISLRHGDRW